MFAILFQTSTPGDKAALNNLCNSRITMQKLELKRCKYSPLLAEFPLQSFISERENDLLY